MGDSHWSHFILEKRIKEEWKEDYIMTSMKFDWEKYGAKKSHVSRGGGKNDYSYIQRSPETDKSREQLYLSFDEDDSTEMHEVLGNRVDIGTIDSIKGFAIIVASGDSLALSKANKDSERRTIACTSIKSEIKENIGLDFIHYELKIKRLAGEQAYILYPLMKVK